MLWSEMFRSSGSPSEEDQGALLFTLLSLETGPCVQSITCIHLVQQINWTELPQIHDSETCFVGPQRYSYFPIFERSHITQLVACTYVCQSCEFNSHCFRFSPACADVVCSLLVNVRGIPAGSGLQPKKYPRVYPWHSLLRIGLKCIYMYLHNVCHVFHAHSTCWKWLGWD